VDASEGHVKASGWGDLVALSEAERERALARFYQLRPVLEEGVPLQRLAHDQRIPIRTAQRWLQRYQREGLVGLAHRPRRDHGQRRMVSPEVQQLIEGLALRKPPPAVAAVHRQVRAITEQHGWPQPSYATVHSIIRGLDPGLVMLAHDGPKKYADRFELVYRREARRPNELWQADHTPLDLWILDERGQPARPWLTIVLDDYSRAVAGYALSLHAPSSIQTALALRQAIWRKGDPHWSVCGIPETFYTDHGSDFTSHHLEQVAADLHMAVVFSTAGKPRGRGKVERIARGDRAAMGSAWPGHGALRTRRRRRGQCDRSRDWRQLSSGPASVRSDRTHRGDQQPTHCHDRGRHTGARETGRRAGLDATNRCKKPAI
jgi:putative transposase